jgi:hypothetical protein
MVLALVLAPGAAVVSSSVTVAPGSQGVCVGEGVLVIDAVLERVPVGEPEVVSEGVGVPVGDAPAVIEGVLEAELEGVASATPAKKKPTPKALPGLAATPHVAPVSVEFATEKGSWLLAVEAVAGAQMYAELDVDFSTIAYALAAPAAPACGRVSEGQLHAVYARLLFGRVAETAATAASLTKGRPDVASAVHHSQVTAPPPKPAPALKLSSLSWKAVAGLGCTTSASSRADEKECFTVGTRAVLPIGSVLINPTVWAFTEKRKARPRKSILAEACCV